MSRLIEAFSEFGRSATPEQRALVEDLERAIMAPESPYSEIPASIAEPPDSLLTGSDADAELDGFDAKIVLVFRMAQYVATAEQLGANAGAGVMFVTVDLGESMVRGTEVLALLIHWRKSGHFRFSDDADADELAWLSARVAIVDAATDPEKLIRHLAGAAASKRGNRVRVERVSGSEPSSFFGPN